MSTAMEQAFSNARTGSQTNRSSAKPAPTPRLTAADVRARRLARLTKRADTTLVIDESVVTDYVEISEELRFHERELEPLRKKHSTIPVEELNRARAELETKIGQCREEIVALSTEFPGIVVQAAKREELRSSARSDSRAVRQLDPTNCDEESVKELLANTITTGTLKIDGDSYIAAVEDYVLQDLEGVVNDFLKAVKATREEEQRERVANVRDYLLGDRPTVPGGGQSPLQLEKAKHGRVSLTRLRQGEGERAFVPVFGSKRNQSGENTGEEYFMGEALLERVEKKTVVTKATRVRLCEILFFQYNREKNELREKGVITLPSSDIGKVQPNLLREAIERQLVKDAESTDRRERANLLAAVASYKDAVTFNDFRFGGKPARWIVDAEWTPNGKQRPSHVTFHVESDGKKFHITEAACDLKEVDETFFGMYTQPTELSALSTDKRWLALAANNRQFEADWELRKAASQHPNVTFVTAENVSNVFGIDGVDGVYAAIARWQQDKSDAPKYVAIGYLVERRGEKVAYPYATSGTAAGLIEKEPDSYPVTDLPLMSRAVARAIEMAVLKDFTKVHEHLKAVATNRS